MQALDLRILKRHEAYARVLGTGEEVIISMRLCC